jgi:cytochrome c-type biogenesis protein CcmH|tara:strand:+ start:2184 stop:3362 length:1179 start_codon:yes stop_codon:yes gene_type:complete
MTGLFWIIAAALAASVALGLLVPLFRRGDANQDKAGAQALRVYQDQLRELDKDLEQGRLNESEASAAKREVQRRLLTADRQSEETAKVGTSRSSAIWGAAMVLLLLPSISLGLYLFYGSPGLPSQPLAERTAELNDRQDMLNLVDQLREKMKTNPDDPQGWFLLGRSYMTMQLYSEAADAFTKAAELENSPVLWSSAGEALAYGAGGNIPPAGMKAFNKALAIDPQEPRALFYQALSYYQAGDAKRALQAWASLARMSPASAPWRPSVMGQIERTASELGTDMASLDLGPAPEPSGAGGPSAEDVAKAAEMSPEEQKAFVLSMVERLQTRLEESPDDLDGWLRLVRAQLVLGDKAEALAALKQAAPLVTELPADSPRRRAVEEGIKRLSATE